MCGIVGVFDPNTTKLDEDNNKVYSNNVVEDIYGSLSILQHRGQDACGIATFYNQKLKINTKLGRVGEALSLQQLEEHRGNIGLGHVRYPTTGNHGLLLAQPFYSSYPNGILFVHNGNLRNSSELKDKLLKNQRHIQTNSDSELMLNVLSQELAADKSKITNDTVFKAVARLHNLCSNGAYACIAVILGIGLVAFRDKYGIRPLVIGRKINTDKNGIANKKYIYIIASESCVFNCLEYEFVRDVAPGECIIIDNEGQLHSQKPTDGKLYHCLFEHIYFARPDSVLDGVDIHKTRLEQGKKLAERIKNKDWFCDIDVVIPIPDTSRTAAQALAEAANLKLREGFMKNRYVGRTFIMKDQATRRNSIRLKLSPIVSELKGKNILLVDDSIVRGNTSKKIVEIVRQAGAKKVFMCSAAPPVKFSNYYGIDIPKIEDLIAHNTNSDAEVAKKLNVDQLYYQTLDDLKNCYDKCSVAVTNFEDSVFSNNYITSKP